MDNMTDTQNKKKWYKKWWVWLVALLIVIAIGSGANNNNSNNNKQSGENLSPTTTNEKKTQKLTLDKYNKIQNGMTYEEVVSIIGFEVSPEVETGEKGSPYYTVSYRYMESSQVEGSLGANASFMFQGGKLTTKAQTGLK